MAETAPKPESSGGKKKLIIIIAAAAVVLLLLIGVAVYFLFLKKSPEDNTAEQKAKLTMLAPTSDQEANIGPMMDIKEFIVNIISTDNTAHYVKASLTLELDNETVAKEAMQRTAQIRDALILLIGNKTFEELQDLQGKKQLKAEIKNKLNSFLKSGRVKNIYFTDFVVQ